MRKLVSALLMIGLALAFVGGVGAAVRPGSHEASPPRPAAAAASEVPVAVLSRQEMLGQLIASGAASKDTIASACPAGLDTKLAPDGSLIRTSGFGIYHRVHPEVWLLADGSCAFDPQAVG